MKKLFCLLVTCLMLLCSSCADDGVTGGQSTTTQTQSAETSSILTVSSAAEVGIPVTEPSRAAETLRHTHATAPPTAKEVPSDTTMAPTTKISTTTTALQPVTASSFQNQAVITMEKIELHENSGFAGNTVKGLAVETEWNHSGNLGSCRFISPNANFSKDFEGVQFYFENGEDFPYGDLSMYEGLFFNGLLYNDSAIGGQISIRLTANGIDYEASKSWTDALGNSENENGQRAYRLEFPFREFEAVGGRDARLTDDSKNLKSITNFTLILKRDEDKPAMSGKMDVSISDIWGYPGEQNFSLLGVSDRRRQEW